MSNLSARGPLGSEEVIFFMFQQEPRDRTQRTRHLDIMVSYTRLAVVEPETFQVLSLA